MGRLKDFRPAAEWKSQIPVPVCDEHPEYTELYWKAWELAHDHIKEAPGLIKEERVCTEVSRRITLETGRGEVYANPCVFNVPIRKSAHDPDCAENCCVMRVMRAPA